MNALRIDPPARQLRGKAFLHAVADAAHCPPTPRSVARWWQQFHPYPEDGQLFMWIRASHGAKPAEHTRMHLYGMFPELREVFENPLWAVLSKSVRSNVEPEETWDKVAQTIHLGDRPLYDCSMRMVDELLFSRVDWPCFAVLLALLRTRADDFMFERIWIERNLMAILALVSTQKPFTAIRNELHQLLAQVLSARYPIADGRGWRSWQDFPIRYAKAANSSEYWRDVGWLSDNDRHRALFMWNRLPPSTCADSVNSHDSQVEFPFSRANSWNRMLRRWQRWPVTMNGYRFDV